MILFQETAPRPELQKISSSRNLVWLTWSDTFRKSHADFDKQLSKISEVEFIYLSKYKDYNYSFSVALSKLDKSFLHDFRNYAYSLFHFDPADSIVFFTNLIDRKINAKLFHFLFALFRSTLTEITNDKMGALYSPLTSGKQESEFPLHCDLYIPKILFNVYEHVPLDASGSSAFLELSELFDVVIPKLKKVPAGTVQRMKRLIYDDIRKDNYDELFELLYDEKYDWSEKIHQVMDKHKFSIKLHKGEGYMLNDRIWMHGRNKTSGGISPKRLHRLIFNNFQLLNK